MNRKNTKPRAEAFSLIEILVVIAILGLLAAVAIPAFKDYSTRAKVAYLYDISQEFQNTILRSYISTGKMPTSVTFPATINGGLASASYTSGTNWKSCTLGANGIDGVYIGAIYAASALGLAANPNNGQGTYYLRYASFVLPSGEIKRYCGGWNSSDINDLPSKYWPKNCTYANMVDAANCIIPTS